MPGEHKKESLPHKVRKALWSEIGKAAWARPRAMHIILLVICVALGFATVTQLRAGQEDPLERLDQEGLVVLLNELDQREETLRAEKSDLQQQLSSLETARSNIDAAREAQKKAAEQVAIISGRIPVHGEGVQMRIVDRDNQLTAAQFVMALGELRNAGAEAIELNGIRLTMRTSFSSDTTGIILDGRRISSPYVWNIVGPAQTMATALDIQAGTTSQIRAKNAEVTITIKEDVRITSVAPEFTPQWARPS